MALQIIPDWMANLEDEDVSFIKRFILASGSLKEMASQYGVTYPTVRLRLDRLIQKIQISEKTEADPYISLIKRLAVQDKLDFETAKLLIGEYKKTKDTGDGLLLDIVGIGKHIGNALEVVIDFLQRQIDVVILDVHNLDRVIAGGFKLIRVGGVVAHGLQVGRGDMDDGICFISCHGREQIRAVTGAIHHHIICQFPHTPEQLTDLIFCRARIGILVFTGLEAQVTQTFHILGGDGMLQHILPVDIGLFQHFADGIKLRCFSVGENIAQAGHLQIRGEDQHRVSVIQKVQLLSDFQGNGGLSAAGCAANGNELSHRFRLLPRGRPQAPPRQEFQVLPHRW